MKLMQICAALVLGGALATSATTVVETHGALGTKGNNVVDSKGNQVQLTGMSLFWDVWMDKFYNRDVVNWLVDDWKCSIVRAAMGIDSSKGGYYLNPQAGINRVTAVVDAAIDKGIYVIIDWHEEKAHKHTALATDFFTQMARKYGDQPNVIFEIFNEPTTASWTSIRGYGDTVIAAIRKYSNNLIIVGTPAYSLNVSAALANPFPQANVAYTLHFYAGTHTDYATPLSVSQTLPLFVTEWGTSTSDGGIIDDSAYTDASQAWYTNLIDPRKISSCNWSISNKDEGSAALIPNASTTGGWNPDTDLSPSGKWVRTMIRKHCADDPTVCPFTGTAPALPDTVAIPGTLVASKYTTSSGVLRETTSEASGGQNLTSLTNQDVSNYPVRVAATGLYVSKARVACASNCGAVSLRQSSSQLDSLVVVPTGGAQTWKWTYGTRRFSLNAGAMDLSFVPLGNPTVVSLFGLQRVEIAASKIDTQLVPGPLNPLGFYYTAPGMGFAERDADNTVSIVNMQNNGNVLYKIKDTKAETLALLFRAAAPAGKGGKLIIKSGATSVVARDTVVIAPSSGAWVDYRADVPLTAGVSSFSLTAVGDTGALFDVSSLQLVNPTSLAPRGKLFGLGLHRFGSELRVVLPASAGFRELQVVGADGRILSKVDVTGLANASIVHPAAESPVWIRLRGNSNATLSVPPLR